MLIRLQRRLFTVPKPKISHIIDLSTPTEPLKYIPESYTEVDVMHKSEEKFTLRIRTKVIDYEYFYSNNTFVDLDTLCKYIRYRDQKLKDDEIYHILEFIISQHWMEQFMTKKMEEMNIVATRLSSIYFTSFDQLYKTFFKACAFGFMTFKEVILNFLLEINRLCYSVERPRLLQLTYNNAYSHNYKNFIASKFEMQSVGEVRGLDDLVDKLQTGLKKKNKVAFQIPDQYKEVYQEFSEDLFLSALTDNATLVDKILDILDYTYKQLAINTDLILEKIEESYAYKNFELNFGKSIPYFRKEQLIRFLNIIYKNVIILHDDLNISRHHINLLNAILNSEKISVLDLALFEIWPSLSAKEISFYIYVLGRIGYVESVFNTKIVDIIDHHKDELRSNFMCFSVLVFGLGKIGLSDPSLWKFIDEFATINFFGMPDSFKNLPVKSVKTFIMAVSKIESVARVWSKTDTSFMIYFGLNFAESLVCVQRRFINNWTTNSDLFFIDRFEELSAIHESFIKLEFKDFIELLQFTVFFWKEFGQKSDKYASGEPNFIEKVGVAFSEYVKSNKKEISGLTMSDHIYLIDLSAQLVFLIKEFDDPAANDKATNYAKNVKALRSITTKKNEDPEFKTPLAIIENSFSILRNQLNTLSKTDFLDENEDSFIPMYHLYLRLGSICMDHQYSHDSYEFFRRKFYKHIMLNLRDVGYRTALNCLEMTFYYNYTIDAHIFDLLAFRIMLDLDKFTIKELNHICLIYRHWLTTREVLNSFNQHSELDLKDISKDLVLSIIYHIVDKIETTDWSIQDFDEDQTQRAYGLVSDFADIYEIEETRELMKKVESLKKGEKDNFLPALLQQYNLTTEFTQGDDCVGLYTQDEIVSRSLRMKNDNVEQLNVPSGAYQILRRYQFNLIISYE